MSANDQRGLFRRLANWWRANRETESPLSLVRQFLSGSWRFAAESLPSRRRQRYGDVDYDWDHRVDTTGATVPWRERFLGMLYSPYQPTEPALFREMMENLQVDLGTFTFIDLGSGKGRTLLMAADYPFEKIIGVELLTSLHEIAAQNISKYRSDSQRCFRLESICADATEFAFPNKPSVLYLFNPLPEAGLAQVVKNLERSLQETIRPFFVIYHNPEHEALLLSCSSLKLVTKTQSYSIFAAKQ